MAAPARNVELGRLHSDDDNLLEPGHPKKSIWYHYKTYFWWGFVALQVLLLVLAITAISLASRHEDGAAVEQPQNVFVKRLAFGSCTERGIGASLDTTWTQGVLPMQPDAWAWLGDMAYMDNAVMDCSLDANKQHPDCSCAPDYLHHPPWGCFAADVDNAARKMRGVLDGSGYSQFLQFMCPDHLAANRFPPAGMDPNECPRAILGTYDDHDYGWNNGNRRQPNKHAMKQVFLDALGVPADSVRRSSARGIYDWVTLNAHDPSRSIDVIMLDERYDRAPLPCHIVSQDCERPDTSSYKKAVCQDYFGFQNVSSPGSCCQRDDDIAQGWCKTAANTDPNYASACDPTSPLFGTVNWATDEQGNLQRANMDDWRQSEEQSGFCEVLGQSQRIWLGDVIQQAAAPVQLFLSGSVLLANPGPNIMRDTGCDDWDCYRPAQVNFLHQIAKSKGCTVVLTGDYHRADIKMVSPLDSNAPYASPYNTTALNQAVFQIMASGMSNSTATGLDRSCGEACCGFEADEAGLRLGGKCAVYGDPNFGVLDFDWEKRRLTMSIYRGDGGGVAKGAGSGEDLTLTIDLTTCQPL